MTEQVFINSISLIKRFKRAALDSVYSEEELGEILGISMTNMQTARSYGHGVRSTQVEDRYFYRKYDIVKWVKCNPKFTTSNYYTRN